MSMHEDSCIFINLYSEFSFRLKAIEKDGVGGKSSSLCNFSTFYDLVFMTRNIERLC